MGKEARNNRGAKYFKGEIGMHLVTVHLKGNEVHQFKATKFAPLGGHGITIVCKDIEDKEITYVFPSPEYYTLQNLDLD
jgi:hypothetical protein